MNKTEYKKAFSQVHPSEKTVERIFEMTTKKNITRAKTFIAVITVAAILFCAALTANAATDGAVSDYITEKVNTIPEDVAQMFKIIINGKQIDIDTEKVSHESITSPDGEECDRYEYKDDNIKVTVNGSKGNLKTYFEVESATGVMETVD